MAEMTLEKGSRLDTLWERREQIAHLLLMRLRQVYFVVDEDYGSALKDNDKRVFGVSVKSLIEKGNDSRWRLSQGIDWSPALVAEQKSHRSVSNG